MLEHAPSDPQEFSAYVRSVRQRLHREAYRLCHEWHEAEDLVQITLWQVYRRWTSITLRDDLVAYTRKTLLHVYLSEHRRAHWRHEIWDPDPPMAEAGGPPVDDQYAVRIAVNQLAPRQRAVLLMRFWLSLDCQQTARALACATGTVSSQTHRALNALRHKLSDNVPSS